MKKYQFIIALLLLVGSARWLSAQNNPEYLGLPGDNLNLYAVMDLFRESETLEAFERSLNDPDLMINNLDLNGDNYVDYLMVFDYPDDKVHNIVLRVALNETEYQDVAVFVIEKFANNSVMIQLIGDELLYGKNYIVEPNYSETPNPGYAGKTTTVTRVDKNVKVVHTTYYEVARWPVIVHIHRPAYVVWRSSWRWGYYPTYWSAWHPYYYHYYYGYHYGWNSHYYAYYRPWHHMRYAHFNKVYYSGIRHYSPTVVININKNYYGNTYSRPETRAEGERVYAQRVSSGSTVPTRGANRSVVEDQNSRGTQTGGTVIRANTPQVGSSSQRAVGGASDNAVKRAERPVQAVRANDTERKAVPASGNASRTSKPVEVNRPTSNTGRTGSAGTVRSSTPAASTPAATTPSTVKRSGTSTTVQKPTSTRAATAPTQTVQKAAKSTTPQSSTPAKRATSEVKTASPASTPNTAGARRQNR